jgi:hypothetical protein
LIAAKKNPPALANRWVKVSQNLEEEEGVSTSSLIFQAMMQ